MQYGHLFSVENFVGDTLGILILRTEITHTKKGVISQRVLYGGEIDIRLAVDAIDAAAL